MTKKDKIFVFSMAFIGLSVFIVGIIYSENKSETAHLKEHISFDSLKVIDYYEKKVHYKIFITPNSLQIVNYTTGSLMLIN